MIVLAADNFSPYQQRLFKNLLARLKLQGCFSQLPLSPEAEQQCQKEDTLVMIISPQAGRQATALMKRFPALQVCAIKQRLDDLIGLTRNLDLRVNQQPRPERQQIKKLLIEYARQGQPPPSQTTLELPREIFLSGSEVLRDWLSEHQEAPIVVCRLTEEATLGIYQEDTPGWHQIEFTRQEINVLVNLMQDLDARLVAVKDAAGQTYSLT